MKETNVVIAILVMLALMVGLRITIFSRNKRLIEEKQLEKANNIISQENTSEIELVTQEELEENENIIGTVEIPKLNLVAPIQEGTSKDILKVAVGHFPESSFWNGNVALASHNRSPYVQYFKRINELQKGDEIIYKTKLGTKKYIVYESREIESTDWSVIANTEENIITLLTCVSNNPEKRLCVRAKEKKENVEEQIELDNQTQEKK